MFRAVLLTAMLLLGSSAESGAGEYFEVTKDSLIGSQVGSLVRVIDPGVEGLTYHAYEAGNRLRLFAGRADGTDEWIVPTVPVYLCPTLEMFAGLGWKFPDDDAGNSRFALPVQAEVVTVLAGTFTSAWRVEVTRDDQPSVVQLTLWFVADVGIVKQVEWIGGVPVWKSELQSFDVEGRGFFPLVVGNWWQYADVTVPVEPRSLGGLKGQFLR